MTSTVTPATTAYAAIGGEERVRAVLDALYARLFVDPMVGFLFDGKDRRRIVDAQIALTCALLGGPQRYTGKPLPQAHAHLPLLPGHFDRRHHLLAEVLAELRVPDAARNTWLAADASLRSSILAAGADARTETQRQP
jgi:truncated hemoglobin YjbI